MSMKYCRTCGQYKGHWKGCPNTRTLPTAQLDEMIKNIITRKGQPPH